MTWQPLEGVAVLVVGASRAIRFAGRTLASLGATVTRVAPPGLDPPPEADPLRGGTSESELRLSSWLDRDTTVVVARDAAEAAQLAAERLSGVAVFLLDAENDLAGGSVPRVLVSPGIDATRPGCGLTAAARSGVAAAVGAPDREPLGLPFNLTDYATGLVAATAAASLLDAAGSRPPDASVNSVEMLAAFAGVNGLVYEPYGIPYVRERRRARNCGGPYPYGFLRASDGDVCLIARSRRDWDRILHAAGDPAWAHDDRYADLTRNGAEYAAELDDHLNRWTTLHTRDELFEIAQRERLALAPVRTPAEALADPSLLRGGALEQHDGATVPGTAIVRTGPARSSDGVVSIGSGAPKPLTGIRVLDLGWVWSAPMAAATLADLGADVVKIEHIERPDNSRLRGRPGPGWIERPDVEAIESVPYFHNVNHGKRSVAIDLKHEDGSQIAGALLRTADVVIENLGEARFAARNLGYETISGANPGLIWLSMVTTRCGPSDMRGYAPTIASYSGLESAIGYTDEMTGMMNFGICDPIAGTWGALAVLAALRERLRTGEGGLLQLGQLEAFLMTLGEQIEEAERLGEVPPRGNTHPYFWPYGVFRCRDGRYVAIAARSTVERERMCEVLGIDAPLDVGAVERGLVSWLAEHDAPAVCEFLEDAVACELVLGQSEMRTDDELRARGLLQEVEHELAGRHLVYSQAWRVDGHALPVERAAPPLGEHTREILHEWLGLDDDRIRDLEEAGALR